MLSMFLDCFIKATAKHMFNFLIYQIENYYLTFTSIVNEIDYALEAHPIHTNHDLITLNIRSHNIKWKNLITPLQPRDLKNCHYLGKNFHLLESTIEDINETNRREVFICHDMMGNYLEDRHYNSSKKWDDYRFYHWSGIDYFCYFSHHYITIPPSGWINAAHLHGVKIIGTFIVEGNSGTQLLLEALSTRAKILQMCDSLVRLCEHFCFDGWFVNIECSVPTDKINYLIFFMRTLQYYTSRRIPNGIVFWYDSITHSGQLDWQNEINNKNLNFFNASDAMLINYGWNDNSIKKTKEIIQKGNLKQSKAFFGIDVFARGQVAKFKSHKTLERIVESNFSIGIFGPGWTFEGLRDYSFDIKSVNGRKDVNDAFLQRNEKYWWQLWQYFATHSYTNLPLYTDFCLGSGKETYSVGKKINNEYFNLSRQNIQPSVPLYEYIDRCYDDAVNGGSSLKILKCDLNLRLFHTNLPINKALIFAYAYKIDESLCDIDLILRFCETNDLKKFCDLYCGEYENTSSMQRGRCYLSPIGEEHYLDISRIMDMEKSPLKIPFILNNGWKVRYFGASFDNLILIRDIGVSLRPKKQGCYSTGLLGSVYLNSFSMNSTFDGMINWGHISNEFVLNG